MTNHEKSVQLLARLIETYKDDVPVAHHLRQARGLILAAPDKKEIENADQSTTTTY